MWFAFRSGAGHGPWFGDRGPAGDASAEDLSGCGLNLFLASLSMLFGAALLGAVIVRSEQAHYAETIGPAQLAGLAVATALLVAAERAMSARGSAPRVRARRGAAFGVAFLLVQGWNWVRLAHDGHGATSGTLESALFHMLTILHALHVAGGLFALAWAARRGSDRTLALCLRYWRYLGVWWIVLLTALLAF